MVGDSEWLVPQASGGRVEPSGAQWWLLEPSNTTIFAATAPGMAQFANVAIVKW